jgi:hypothetical protein
MSREETDAFSRPGVETAFTDMFKMSVKTLKSSKITWQDFLGSCTAPEATYFTGLKAFAESRGMGIEMGTVGFSVRSTKGASMLWCFPAKSGKGLEVQFTRSKLHTGTAGSGGQGYCRLSEDKRRLPKRSAKSPVSPAISLLKTVEEVVRATLRNPDRFTLLASEDALAAVRDGVPTVEAVCEWSRYHAERYGW